MSDPYGSWQSPVTAELVAAGGVDLGHLALDDGTAYWHERRPDEGGRGVVVRETADGHEDVTPADVDVRTLVHEYGGGDFAVYGGVVYYARYDDQRVYRIEPGSDPEPITREPKGTRGLRYADLTVAPGGDRIYAVREDHDAVVPEADRDDVDVDEPVTTLVAIPADGEGSPETLARGHDFFAAPRPSPEGDSLAWLTWDHPRMPWDGTTLHVADVARDGSLRRETTPMGGREEAVFDPTWGPDETLYAVSDRTGWWNPYRVDDGPEPLVEREAEYGVPAWLFGLSTLAVLDDGRVAAVVTEDGRQHLELLDGDGREVVEFPRDTLSPARLWTDGTALVLEAADATTPTGVVRWTPGAGTETLRASATVDVDEAYLSTPEHLVYETRDGAEAHAYVYPPTNPDVEVPGDEKPPLVVMAHGGPTSATHPALDLTVQFFTSRGFVVADVNYRGSTGYGRAYREALYGEWGRVDVQDTVDAALHLADERRVDPDRMAVRGGSAGGFVVLAALAFHGAFTAGASYYGVADLARLAELTHKFESRYLHQLVGPYPEDETTYRARSPVHHAAKIDVPLLLLQGAEDPVVPLSQAESMARAVSAPHDLLVFEDEQHGFRAADARRRAHEAELAFYAEVFGFDPADDDLAAPELE